MFNVSDLRESASIDFGVATAKMTEGTKFCEKASSIPEKNSCYTSIAKNRGDVEICNQIQDTNAANLARDACYRIAGISKRDPSICGDITSKYYKDECMRNI